MANGLIGKVTAGGGTHLIASTAYFTCDTAAATAAKIAKAADTGLNSFTVITGMTIYVKFTYANGVANPTLTLQTNGGTQLLAAKHIMRYGSTAPSTNAASSWKAGAVVALTYDGTNWVEVSSIDDNTTYSVMSVSEMKTGTATSNRVIRASYLKSAFTDSDGIFKTGSANGTISVYGTDIAVKGLGSRAYDSTSYLPLTGGTLTGPIEIDEINNNTLQSSSSLTTNSLISTYVFDAANYSQAGFIFDAENQIIKTTPNTSIQVQNAPSDTNYVTLNYNSLTATGIDVESNPSEVGFTFNGANKIIDTTSNATVNINGYLYVNNSELTIASSILDTNEIQYSQLKMTGATNLTQPVLQAYNGDQYGVGVMLGGSGPTIVGSGESHTNLVNNDVNGVKAGTTENLHLASDYDIYFYSNCQTIANRKQMRLDSNGNLTVPGRIKQNAPDIICAWGTYSAVNTTVTLTSAYTNYNFLILRFGADDSGSSSMGGVSTMIIPTSMINSSNQFQHGWYQGTAWQNMKFQFPTTTTLKILTRTGSAAGLRQIFAF